MPPDSDIGEERHHRKPDTAHRDRRSGCRARPRDGVAAGDPAEPSPIYVATRGSLGRRRAGGTSGRCISVARARIRSGRVGGSRGGSTPTSTRPRLRPRAGTCRLQPIGGSSRGCRRTIPGIRSGSADLRVCGARVRRQADRVGVGPGEGCRLDRRNPSRRGHERLPRIAAVSAPVGGAREQDSLSHRSTRAHRLRRRGRIEAPAPSRKRPVSSDSPGLPPPRASSTLLKRSTAAADRRHLRSHSPPWSSTYCSYACGPGGCVHPNLLDAWRPR